ncbi:HD domain-containing protein [Clostridium gasigenes]|uniref:HD domain-containing protein n=1 Tax=Clostridium gasigenes TaxID=94869 RepID=A0A7X0SA18_9CLOT|nr:HD domain-containing protein [Clostridium gasigenes]MBB6713765.1 HD domain-containing protein [Clostridium gasigenes]
MERVNKILYNKKYKDLLNKLNELEKERVFCKHNMEHFLDVARIAYIKVLEEGLNYNKEVIYAIALLHDMGRVLQYENGTPHDLGSITIAKDILDEIDFSLEEKELIMESIKDHRGEGSSQLSKIISKSDKLSRKCFICDSQKDCYWDKSKKNMEIII